MSQLNRRVEIATRPGEARAVVEDDYHHFRVIIWHDGVRVTRTAGQSPRYPWATCPLAAERLHELEGMALTPSATAVGDHTPQRQQCTHMFDLAGLAIACAARGIRRRRYDIAVPDRIGGRNGRSEPSIRRDGAPVFIWRLSDAVIEGPAPFEGVSLRAGFADWAAGHLSLDEVEAAFVLRRAIFISGGRGVDLDAYQTPPNAAAAGCFTNQPERVAAAFRRVGSTLDFSARADELAGDDQAWLAFAAD